MKTARPTTVLFVFVLSLLLACQISNAPGLSFVLPTSTPTTQTPILVPTASQTATLTAIPNVLQRVA